MNNTTRTKLIYALVGFLLIGFRGVSQQQVWLDSICENFKQKHDIVGMTIAVVKPDTSYFSVSGLRKLDEPEKLTLENNFFLASLSKAFTALIAKKMEEEGLLNFETKFFDIFPELRSEKKAKKYAGITLGDLLSHKARINDAFLYDTSQFLQNASNREKRFHLVKLSLSKSPKGKNKYSNVGYLMAAVLLEKVANTSYEELLKKTLEDLELSYTVGYPKTHNAKDTWGHNVLGKGEKTFELSVFNFYADFQLPFWGIAMNTIDYATFVRLHLNGLLGEHNILKSSSYKALHQTYKKQNYGWERKRLGDYTVSTHDGSGEVFFTRVVIAPEAEVGVFIFMNQTATGLKKINHVLETIITQYKN